MVIKHEKIRKMVSGICFPKNKQGISYIVKTVQDNSFFH